MLPKEYRLRRMKEFGILFSEGGFFGARLLGVRVWKIDPEKFPKKDFSTEDLRIGVVVGKKVHKSAVKRNKIKRQMREVVRLLLKDDAFASGYLVAFVAHPSILNSAYQDIETEILRVSRRAGILK